MILKFIKLMTLLYTSLAMTACSHMESTCSTVSREIPIFNEQRLALTRVYSKAHYGIDSYRMENPRMIVVHYTAFPSLEETLKFFTPTLLSREDIKSGGNVNVSAHYLVDKSGEVIHLAPDDVICRHIIGFNHVAIGIENVAADKDGLTTAQLDADARLINELVKRFPTIEYMVGHHEYQDRTLPHFALNLELDSSYKPTVKIDPGEEYMLKLRKILKEEYGVVLKQ